MAEWTTLSYDTRLIILNMVFARLNAPEEHQPVRRPLRRTPGLIPSHALVCRDWFDFFERETYRNIFVTQASLENIRRLTRRQQSLITAPSPLNHCPNTMQPWSKTPSNGPSISYAHGTQSKGPGLPDFHWRSARVHLVTWNMPSTTTCISIPALLTSTGLLNGTVQISRIQGTGGSKDEKRVLRAYLP
ncbi:hypothetical protein C2857_005472 [Epichloe festucae Fl1]|uniref:Uncharacterized protein n=1 Tax=Epichloe festucae (strain Fl1) TaxID=877507 RepID=A0A7S9PSC7_EPIFF|nr:hypothetical protein C2857_005472 [Epichloe festucae Fl1]